MAGIIAAVGPCRFKVRSEGTHYEAVFRSIMYQQLAGAAALAIHRRVRSSRTCAISRCAPRPAKLK
jgi:hypothetical protein